MSKFSYRTDMGEYSAPVRLSIELSIDDGLNKEDYDKLRSAFQIIEDIAYRYKAIAERGQDEDTSESD